MATAVSSITPPTHSCLGARNQGLLHRQAFLLGMQAANNKCGPTSTSLHTQATKKSYASDISIQQLPHD